MKKFVEKLNRKVLNTVTKSEMELNREEFVTKWKLEHNIPLRKRVVFTERNIVENKLVGKNFVSIDSPVNNVVVRRKIRRKLNPKGRK